MQPNNSINQSNPVPSPNLHAERERGLSPALSQSGPLPVPANQRPVAQAVRGLAQAHPSNLSDDHLHFNVPVAYHHQVTQLMRHLTEVNWPVPFQVNVLLADLNFRLDFLRMLESSPVQAAAAYYRVSPSQQQAVFVTLNPRQVSLLVQGRNQLLANRLRDGMQ